MDATALTVNLLKGTAQAAWRAFRRKRESTEAVESDLKAGILHPTEDRHLKQLVDESEKKASELLCLMYGGRLEALPLNERKAAVAAVKRTLDSRPLSISDLVDSNLDPKQLRKGYSAIKHRVLRDAALSDRAELLYNELMTTVTDAMIAFSMELISVRQAVTRKQLTTLDELIGIAREAQRTEAEHATQAEEELEAFRAAYRRGVSARFGHTELYGISVSPNRRRLPLTTAYITLRSVPRNAGDAAPGMTCEAAVASSDRILIEGVAGSGKTTLMHRLMLSSADNPQEGRVAFFIPLRSQYAKLPGIAEFVGVTVPPLAGEAPQGWTKRLMEAGRGTVLVDGFDEVPIPKRRAALEWLLELMETFPNCRYVLTSRPAGGLEEAFDSFDAYRIEPLRLDEIDAFANHWHRAVAEARGLTYGESGLPERESMFKLAIRSSDPLRSLAQTPLLAAIMCALHDDRRAKLPHDRMDLYRMALEMLVWRREAERDAAGENPAIGYKERHLLLRDLAHWMMRNEFVDAERRVVVDRLKRKAFGMPSISAKTGEEIYQTLLERTGLIREETAGRVSFVHRTFQEYLAAESAIDEDAIGEILRFADDSGMHDFVILAAGHANRRQREAIFNGLLDRGEKRKLDRKRLAALAVACLETSPELDPTVRDRLKKALDGLTPPQSPSQAEALAKALGPNAIPLLTGWEHQNPGVVASCISGLSTIGTDSALAATATYRFDTRKEVVNALIAAWSRFAAEEYAQLVLSGVDFGARALSLDARLAQIAAQYIPNPPLVRLDAGLSQLPAIRPDLQGIVVSVTIRVEEVSAERKVQGDALTLLAKMPLLRSVTIHGSLGTSIDTSPLLASRLEELNVFGWSDGDLRRLGRGFVERLTVEGHIELVPPEVLGSAAVLKVVTSSESLLIGGESSECSIRELIVMGLHPGLNLVVAPPVSRAIDSLTLRNVPLASLGQFENLRVVTADALGVAEKRWLEAQPRLSEVIIDGCPRINLSSIPERASTITLMGGSSETIISASTSGAPRGSLTLKVSRARTTYEALAYLLHRSDPSLADEERWVLMLEGASSAKSREVVEFACKGEQIARGEFVSLREVFNRFEKEGRRH